MSVISKVAGMLDIKRAAEVYCQMRRTQLAQQISSGSEGVTQADAYHMIRKMESDVVREFDKEGKDIPDVGLKLMAQTALISTLGKEFDDDGQE